MLAEVFWCNHCAMALTSGRVDILVFILQLLFAQLNTLTWELAIPNLFVLLPAFVSSGAMGRAGSARGGAATTPTVSAGATCRKRTGTPGQAGPQGVAGRMLSQGALEDPCSQNPILPLLLRAGSGDFQRGGHRVSA